MSNGETKARGPCDNEPCKSALLSFYQAESDLFAACGDLSVAKGGKRFSGWVAAGAAGTSLTALGTGAGLSAGAASATASLTAAGITSGAATTGAATALGAGALLTGIVAPVAVVIAVVFLVWWAIDAYKVSQARKKCQARLQAYNKAYMNAVRSCPNECKPSYAPPCNCA